MNNTLDYLTALYFTLEKMEKNFRPEDYKWKIGVKVLQEAKLLPPCMELNEKTTLFGIAVEIDYVNPNNVQIFEDITNKIYIDKGADNDTSREKS